MADSPQYILRLMKQLNKTRRPPLLLTVNGKAEAVPLVAAAHQDVADHLDAVASIRRGLAQAKKTEGRSADNILAELDEGA